MLKLSVAVFAVALAGTASAGWRSMRIGASNEASFDRSVAALQEKLPGVRKNVLAWSLQDIWAEGMQAAEAEQREYTLADYLRQIDGLRYKDVIAFTDPTGETADRYWGRAYAILFEPGDPSRENVRRVSRNSGGGIWPNTQVTESPSRLDAFRY